MKDRKTKESNDPACIELIIIGTTELYGSFSSRCVKSRYAGNDKR